MFKIASEIIQNGALTVRYARNGFRDSSIAQNSLEESRIDQNKPGYTIYRPEEARIRQKRPE